MIRAARHMMQSLLGLLTIGWMTRGRIAWRYWAWRSKTAFGPNSPRSRLPSILAFARWVWLMRRFTRPALSSPGHDPGGSPREEHNYGR